jgi:hypothetical protein
LSTADFALVVHSLPRGCIQSGSAKARRIYEWIVDNTFRDPKTRGCGIGDIASMLKTGDLGGKCADLNALYVGLARAVGLPVIRMHNTGSPVIALSNTRTADAR